MNHQLLCNKSNTGLLELVHLCRKKKMSKVIDVRTPFEFSGGHVAGSLNIPLTEIPQRIDELKAYNEHIIFCCASGNRSGQATNYLRQFGIDCENGGSWTSVNFKISQLS